MKGDVKVKRDCLLDRFDQWVETTPDALLFRRLDVRHARHETLSYIALHRRVEEFAAGLDRISAPGDRILLTFPSGIEFILAFLGCLAVRRIPVPHAVLRSSAGAGRLSRIIADCQASLCIAPAAIAEKLSSLIDGPGSHPVVAFEKVVAEASGAVTRLESEPDDIAFLQYTSGSTGQPKGVIVTHGNLSANLEQIGTALPQEISHVVSWLPQFHDMGLVGATLAPIYLGVICSFFSPSEFIQRPLRWLTALSELKADVSVAPNFGYAYVLQRCKSEDIASLNLSHVRLLMTGAEPVKSETLQRFTATLRETGLRDDIYFPTYGLAEATLFVSGGPDGKRISTARMARDGHRCLEGETVEAGCEVVSCGAPGSAVEVRIYKPHSEVPVSPGEVGEICIRGENVTPGYWGKPPNDPARRLLRTGDLGFMRNGELFIAGRLKDLIILRGRNIYPQDIETVAQNLVPNGSENSCAAILHEDDLILVQELPAAVRDKHAHAVLTSNITTRIAEMFEIRVDRIILTRSNTIPRTTSGKLSRSSLALSLCTQEFPSVFDTSKETMEQA